MNDDQSLKITLLELFHLKINFTIEQLSKPDLYIEMMDHLIANGI